MDKPAWEEKTNKAYAQYLAAVKADLPANASFADMERAILKHSPELLRANLESLASDEAFSPRDKGRT